MSTRCWQRPRPCRLVRTQWPLDEKIARRAWMGDFLVFFGKWRIPAIRRAGQGLGSEGRFTPERPVACHAGHENRRFLPATKRLNAPTSRFNARSGETGCGAQSFASTHNPTKSEGRGSNDFSLFLPRSHLRSRARRAAVMAYRPVDLPDKKGAEYSWSQPESSQRYLPLLQLP